MSTLLTAELAATCNALGYFDTSANKYYTDENVLETLKDLIRYLRRDENFDVRRQLGETEVLKTDLLPLLKSYWEEQDLFDVVLRLLVNLTTPALILWNEEVPTEKLTRKHYLQIEEHLQSYKQAFADDSVWAILSTKLSKILELEYAERGDENSLIIERILILVRNVLYVPSDPDTEKRPDHDANLHDQVLWALRQSGMLDIILYIASSPAEQVYYMHILEILSFLLREQLPTNLAISALERNQTEKLHDEAQLLAIRHQENNQKREKVKQFTSARHSRFGGTYVVTSMKSIGDNELIYHKPLNRIDKISFDVDKTKMKVPKNRQPVKDKTRERQSAFSVRLFLKEFCIEFLNGAYNALMHNVKNTLARAKAQAHDESYYLWALRFFMEFNRAYKFEVKLVSETVSIPTFHFVQQQMEHHFDMISTDKKKFLLWSKRLHLALLAYRELLLTVNAMDNCNDTAVKESAKVIKSNIFYVIEYRELVLTLLITFDELKMSQTYLKDLIETQHVFFKMLQKFCQRTGTVVVEEKKRKQRKKKSKTQKAHTAPTIENLWEEVSLQLPQILAGQVDQTEVIPYDASSDIPIDDQKSDAMKTIQTKMRNKDLDGAVAFLRAAREVWPENDVFGGSIISPDEEYLILQEIFHTDLGISLQPTETVDVSDGNETDIEEEPDDYSENVFKFEDFVKRLAHPKIVRGCSLCLRNFEKNSVFTNNCVVKLLHRIAVDCKMYVLLFQVSIFRVFQNIYALKGVPQHKELVKFATYIIRQFFMVARANPKVYLEALFWKSSKDAYDIVHGYGSYHQKSQAVQKAWSELEEQQLQVLFEEHQRNGVDEDVVDWITRNLIDNNRSRRGVLKKLKEMDLLTNYKRQDSKKRDQPWTVNEENELRELFEQFREADDPLGSILGNLTITRSKNRVIEKLLVMGVIQDKSEIRKKRQRKSKARVGNDDSDQDVPSTSRKRLNTTNVSAAKKAMQRKRKFTKQSSTELKKVLLDIKDQSLHSDALHWISESFSEAADDLETTNGVPADDGIPLVPILECYETALEDETFKKFLNFCGILEPADEQEIYWRIPNNVPPTDLRQYATLISDVLQGIVTSNDTNEHAADDTNQQEDDLTQFRSEAESEIENSDTEGSISSHSEVPDTEQREQSDDDREDKIRSASDSTEQNKPESSNSNYRKSVGRLRLASDSDSQDEVTEVNRNKEQKPSRILHVSDSEDEQDKERRALSDEAETDKRSRDRISDSDGEQPKRKRTRILSSDED